ncbi:MAG: hypothetical protein MAG453_01608 [Calditrichaeota bacterium]|nr:hypothetical protein [Calditrichota bacterium]
MQQSPDTGYVFSGEHIYQLDASWQIEWELSPGGEDSGNVSTVFVFRDGYYVSGSIAGGAEYFGRISSNGELLWSRVFGEPDWDLVQSAAPIPGDRGVFVAGVSETLSDDGETTALFVARLDPDGAIVWLRTYPQLPAWIMELILRDDGRLLACGSATGSGGYGWSYALLSHHGEVLRVQRGMDVRDAVLLADGGVIASGAGGGLLVRRDARLNPLWSNMYYHNANETTALLAREDGSFVFGCNQGQYGLGRFHIIATEPELPPLEIDVTPAAGGDTVDVQAGEQFSWSWTLTNNMDEPQAPDVWAIAMTYDYFLGEPFALWEDQLIQPGETVAGEATTTVPPNTPSGEYRFFIRTGYLPTYRFHDWFTLNVNGGGPVREATAGELIWPTRTEPVSGWPGARPGFHTRLDQPRGRARTGGTPPLPLTSVKDNLRIHQQNWWPGSSDSGVTGVSVAPNPFNAATTVTVALPRGAASLRVVVYDVTGREVATLHDGPVAGGAGSSRTHRFTFDGSTLASGLYFLRATVPGQLEETRKMMLVR